MMMQRQISGASITVSLSLRELYITVDTIQSSVAALHKSGEGVIVHRSR